MTHPHSIAHELAEIHYLDSALTPRQMRKLERKTKKHDSQCQKSTQLPTNLAKEYSEKKPFNLVPKTKTQGDQILSLKTNMQTICLGPAGTGKTYVTAAWAAIEFDHGRIKKLVLTRPNIPAGPTLGLFPGSLQEKYANWLAPLVSVIKEVLGEATFDIALKRGDIIYQPMETIRGASFDDAVIIADEAQNLTEQEMKALVTRIGENSKLILDGDLKQKDIKAGSGLDWAIKTVKKSEFLNEHTGVIEFNSDDVVRSEICKAWIKAIENE